MSRLSDLPTAIKFSSECCHRDVAVLVFFKEIGKEFTGLISVARKQKEQQVRDSIARLIDNLYVHHGPRGLLARTWPTGSMVIWVAVLLGLSLLLYYF